MWTDRLRGRRARMRPGAMAIRQWNDLARGAGERRLSHRNLWRRARSIARRDRYQPTERHNSRMGRDARDPGRRLPKNDLIENSTINRVRIGRCQVSVRNSEADAGRGTLLLRFPY